MGRGLLFKFVLLISFFVGANAFAESVQEQAAVVVRAALDSGLIRSDEIRQILVQIRDEVLPRQDLIVYDPDGPGCGDSNNRAQVPPVLPIRIHTCPSFYERPSPQTMIHEAVHVVQLSRVLALGNLRGECLADLVAIEATAAAVNVGAVPAELNVIGFYFQAHMCSKSVNKYRIFLSSFQPTT
jgi:hypothetical protein